MSTTRHLLENENWVPVEEIIPEFHTIISNLLTTHHHHPDLGPPTCTQHTGSYISYLGNKYYVVQTLMMFAKLLWDYVGLISSLGPWIRRDIVDRIVSLFLLFNSDTYHLVMRQGNRQRANSEKINVKHLGT